MNLAALRARVRDLTDLRLVTLCPDATIDAYLNETYTELMGSKAWPLLERTTVYSLGSADASATAVTPEGIRSVLGVTVADGSGVRELSPLPAAQAAEAAAHYAGGAPLFYRLTGSTVTLVPALSAPATVTVRWLARVAPLTADDAVPVIAEEYHAGLAYGAAARLLTRESDSSGRIEAYFGEYQSAAKRMAADYLTSDDRSPIVAGGRRSSARARRLRGWQVSP